MTDSLISLQRPPTGQASRTGLSFPGYKYWKDCQLDAVRHPTPESQAGATVGQFTLQILGDVVRV